MIDPGGSDLYGRPVLELELDPDGPLGGPGPKHRPPPTKVARRQYRREDYPPRPPRPVQLELDLELPPRPSKKRKRRRRLPPERFPAMNYDRTIRAVWLAHELDRARVVFEVEAELGVRVGYALPAPRRDRFPTATAMAELGLRPAVFYYACRRIADGEELGAVAKDLKLTSAQVAYVLRFATAPLVG